jgi:AraC-like DNA-binding protein
MSNHSLTYYLKNIRSKQPWLVLSAAKTFSLVGSDNPFISHFYSFEANDSKQATFAIPDGCVDILFDCDNTQPIAEVYGTPLEAIDIRLHSKHRYFGVRFASGVMPDFLNISASELIAQKKSLLDLIPDVNQLVDEIVSNSSFSAQAALFKKFMSNKSTRKYSPLTSQVVQQICHQQGNIKIKELENLTGYSSRTLQRKFHDDMGLSPKTYSRIIRCQSAIYKINNGDKIAFSDLAYDLGFTDQSHFLRDFKRHISTTPLGYQTCVKDKSYLNKIEYICPRSVQ